MMILLIHDVIKSTKHKSENGRGKPPNWRKMLHMFVDEMIQVLALESNPKTFTHMDHIVLLAHL